MAKNSGGANKSQSNLLVQHVEKIGLAVTIVIGAVFVWSGFSIDKLDQRKTPEKLKEKSTSITTFINDDSSWEGQDGEPGLSSEATRLAPSDYPDRVQKLQQPILSQNYETVMPFDPPTVGQTTRRSDPNLYVAMDLRAVAITASLAYKKSADVDDETAEDLGPEFEIIQKRKPRKKKNENTADFGGGGSEMMEGMMEGMEGAGMEEGMGESMMGQTDDVATLLQGQLIGFRPGENKILESGTVVEIKGAGRAATTGGDAGGEASGMQMAEMSEGEGMGEGMMDGGMMDGGMMGGGGNAASASNSIPQPSTVVAVVGVVPYKKQWDEYSRVLQGASGYEASRDRPRYIYLKGERVNVTDNPNRAINDGEWEPVTNFAQYTKDTRDWDGSPHELVDKKYLDPFLTFVCPPIMMRDLSGMLSHPLIPLRNAPEKVADDDTGDEPDDDPQNAPSDAPGGEIDPSNAAAMPQGGGNAGSGMGEGMMGGGMMGGGMMGEGMMGGGMMGGGNAVASQSIPEFMMVRFFDLTAVPGQVYRYRVGLLMEDPNHPNIRVNTNYPQHIAPPARSLDEDVIARIAQLDDPEHKSFWRQTEWSEPTAPVLVPDPTQIFAGSVAVQTPSKAMMQGASVSYLDKEPLGTLLPVIWDKDRGVDIPLRKDDVRRGSVLNKPEADVHYGHPASLQIKRIEKFPFETGLIVGDIRGGEKLPWSTKEWQVTSPGEFALFDSKGNLVIHNELDDLDGFKRYDFKEQLTREETGSPTSSGNPQNDDDLFNQ